MGRKVLSLAEFTQRDPLRVYARAGLLTDIADATHAVTRFKFIDQAQALGLTLGEIQALLACAPSASSRIFDRRNNARPRVEVIR